jgi:spermidine synthase
VVWARLLVPLIGATSHAQAVVLAVFLGGLALGAVHFGRRVDRRGRPLRLYVALELAVAGLGLALPVLVEIAGLFYIGFSRRFFELPGARLALGAGLATLAVLPSAIAMGGTLPALARHAVAQPAETRREVGRLYAWNAFGAMLGAGLGGLVLLPVLGVLAALLCACLLSAAAGLLVLAPARAGAGVSDGAGKTQRRSARATKRSRAARRAAAETASAEIHPLGLRAALLALFLSGFAALGYEVLFTRVIALAYGASSTAFALMLVCFLGGIAVGGALVARLRLRDPLFAFAASQLAAVAALLAATPLIARLPWLAFRLRAGLAEAPAGFETLLLAETLLCLAVLLLPTACLGFSFPLVAQIRVLSSEHVGRRVGAAWAWNTLGNVLGAIGTSLVLLPGLGLVGSFHGLLAVNASAALLLLALAARVPATVRLGAALATAVAAAVYLAGGAGWADPLRLAPNQLGARLDRPRAAQVDFASWHQVFVEQTRKKLLFFGEDAHAAVFVVGSDEDAILFVDGKPDASTTASDLETQLLLGHAPLFLAPEARSVLVVGQGGGITTGAVLTHPVERVEVVEIARAVLDADRVMSRHNRGALSDPRVRVFQDDGQSFLRATPRRYDVVISEPSNPWMAGVADLFTEEFFESVRDRLEPTGVFCFWFHTYLQNDASVALVLRTLGTVFPHALLFTDADLGNVVALASPAPLEPRFAAMEERFRRPAVRDDLARIGVPNLAGLLSHHRFSEQDLRRFLPAGPTNRLLRQRLEYSALRSVFVGEASSLLDQQDPFTSDALDPGDVLYFRYQAWRAASGAPLSQAEIDAAAEYAISLGGYGEGVAATIRARASVSPSPGG